MCTIEKDCIPLIQIDDHHPALCIKVMDILYRERSFDTNSHAKVYNFKKADFIRLYDALTDTDWSFLESIKDVNLAVDEFYKRIYEVLDSHVPQYKNYRRKFPQWYDATIIINIKEKAKIRRKWKQTNDTRFKYAFEDLRSIIKSHIKDAYRNHLRAVERSVKQDPASFWSFIHQKNKTSRIPGNMSYQGDSLGDPQSIVDAFANFFKSVYSPNEPCDNYDSKLNTHFSINLTQQCITEQGIYVAAKKLKNKMTAGPVLFRSRKLYTPEQLLLLYKAQVRPSLEYCSHV
nr:unnamed protein product [Callosobruchus analis]